MGPHPIRRSEGGSVLDRTSIPNAWWIAAWGRAAGLHREACTSAANVAERRLHAARNFAARGREQAALYREVDGLGRVVNGG